MMDANKVLTTLILTIASLHCTDVIDSCHCLWHAAHGDEGAELLFKGLSWMAVKAQTYRTCTTTARSWLYPLPDSPTHPPRWDTPSLSLISHHPQPLYTPLAPSEHAKPPTTHCALFPEERIRAHPAPRITFNHPKARVLAERIIYKTARFESSASTPQETKLRHSSSSASR
ncbi:hypothetical protein NMY22_g17363 [Coprinellus aureogranulatus]|nr:hypothetical protein NMY22_g17363 [Coprinellus aureogranulatus]